MRIFDSARRRVPPTETPDPDSLQGRIIDAIKTVYDPEIPVNLYDLGLIYEIAIDDATGTVRIAMTLTSPNCPVADDLVNNVGTVVADVDGAEKVSVDLVWEPKWDREQMCDEAKLELGLL